MLNGVCQFAGEANWILDTMYYHTGQLPPSWEGDGIICLMHVPKADPRLTAFIKANMHCPTVGLSFNDPSLKLPRVLQDNPTIGKQGAEHLVSMGCRRLGFVIHGKNHFHEERYQGFLAAARELDVPTVLLRAPSNFVTHSGGPNWLTRHIPDGERPFGIMAAADYLAQWVTKACGMAGWSIPEDVALLGVDNCREICELSPVGISSICNNAFRHGYEGARLLQDIMDGKPAPREPIRVPPGPLHVRQSTDIVAPRHPHVATAISFIAENYSDHELTPGTVASRVPMSARRLHDAFIKYIGRSIYQEIISQRINCAMHLIQETDRKLADIAEATGFGSPEAMSRLFRQKLGHPPSHYRNVAAD